MESFLGDLLGLIIKVLLIYITLSVIISFTISPRRTFGNIVSRWHHPFDEMLVSTKEFYELVRDAINSKGVEDISIAVVKYSSWGLLSYERLYLQVRRGDQMFLICAAPFGTGYFVSWWFGEPLNFIKDLIPRIPNIGKALALLMFSKTFFQMDTDDMFQGMVKGCVNEVIDKITNEKSTRAMTDLERMPIQVPITGRLGG